jgi:hypothetical protein
MKNPFKSGVTVICMLLLVQSCTENNPVTVQKSSTKIAFTLDEIAAPSTIASHDLFISIEDLNGQLVLSNHKLSFRDRDESFLTEDLNLPFGTYVITDLRLENEQEIIFEVPGKDAMPRTSSDSSLPFRFTISGENATPLSFQFKQAKVKHKFDLAAWIEGSGGLQYTSATAYLKDGDSVLATYYLAAQMNTLGFNFDSQTAYTLLVSKEGYEDFTQSFIYKDIKHDPVNVTLTPVSNLVTMKGTAQFNGTDYVFQFPMWAKPGAAISAEYNSQGKITAYYDELNPVYSFSLLHTDPQEYNVTITGDLDMVTECHQDYGGLISEINLSGFTNIEQISLAFHPLTSIDFSANKNLHFLYFYGMPSLTDFTLPEDHFINDFNISGNTGLSAAKVDEAISNIYANAITKNIDNGQISISTEYYGGSVMLGPPSEASIEKLTELRDVHGWYIWPEF